MKITLEREWRDCLVFMSALTKYIADEKRRLRQRAKEAAYRSRHPDKVRESNLRYKASRRSSSRILNLSNNEKSVRRRNAVRVRFKLGCSIDHQIATVLKELDRTEVNFQQSGSTGSALT